MVSDCRFDNCEGTVFFDRDSIYTILQGEDIVRCNLCDRPHKVEVEQKLTAVDDVKTSEDILNNMPLTPEDREEIREILVNNI